MDKEYIQFLKNMIRFTKVFGGPYNIVLLEKELRELEDEVNGDFEAQEKREMEIQNQP